MRTLLYLMWTLLYAHHIAVLCVCPLSKHSHHCRVSMCAHYFSLFAMFMHVARLSLHLKVDVLFLFCWRCLPWSRLYHIPQQYFSWKLSFGVLGNHSRCFNNRNNAHTCAIVFQKRPHPRRYLCWLAGSPGNSNGKKGPVCTHSNTLTPWVDLNSIRILKTFVTNVHRFWCEHPISKRERQRDTISFAARQLKSRSVWTRPPGLGCPLSLFIF